MFLSLYVASIAKNTGSVLGVICADPFGLQYAPEGPPEIAPDEIHCLEVIGSGSFGKVVRGKCRGKEVAIKILHKPVTFSDQKTRDAFQKEVAIMRYANMF